MTQQQPEALRLVDQVRDMTRRFKTPSHERGVCNGVVQELQRLHALNAQMLEALEASSLEVVRLLDAKGFDAKTRAAWPEVVKARAAIAAAKEQA